MHDGLSLRSYLIAPLDSFNVILYGHPSKYNKLNNKKYLFSSAMWSGRFVHLTKSWNNYKCLDPNATTWMNQLQQSGYRTLSLGKLDFTSGGHSVR